MLNEQQLAAANALVGPVLISAGAGSGKTRTLAERFTHALRHDDCEPWAAARVDEILAITFTDKAAGELAERIRATLKVSGQADEARAVDGAWISTIHGFCSRILRRYALEAGLDPAFGVADTVELGRMEERAFESAATAVLKTEDGTDLFGSFEFDAVFEASKRIIRELRTRGLDATALESAPAGSARDLHRRALDLFFGAGPRVLACGDSKVSTTQLAERCDAAAAALACIEIDRLPEVELARETWKALAAWTPPRSNAAIAEVRTELVAEHARLRGEAATASVEPYIRVMKSLIAGFLDEFDRIKRERGFLDFDDLQLRTLKLLEGSEEIRNECRAMFRMAMVDEFQDTDELQAALVAVVAGQDLCTVGDEHQAIYGFRGADVGVYRAHNARMKDEGAREFALLKNYRSHGAVLAFVNEVFGSEALFGPSLARLEHGRIEPADSIVPDDAPRVDIVMAKRSGRAGTASLRAEARAVAGRFAELRDRHGVPGGDMVMLLRAYTHAETYAEELRAAGFEVAIVGGSRFLSLPEIVIARALVRVIANPCDETAMEIVLASDVGRLSDDALWLLAHARDETGRRLGLWGALGSTISGLSERDQERSRSMRAALEAAAGNAGEEPLADTILRVIEECGLDLIMLTRGNEGRQAYANLLKFARLSAEFEAGGGSGPLGFSVHLDSKERYGDHIPPATLADEGSPAVRIMSVHASKGLEFPVVAVCGLGGTARGDSRIVRTRVTRHGRAIEMSIRLPLGPTSDAGRPTAFTELDDSAKAAELEEAKRVFYVACTRAEEVLLLSGAISAEGTADNPMAWVRTALPPSAEEPGDEPRCVMVGGVPVRVEVVTCPGDEPEPEPGAPPVVPPQPAEPQVLVQPARQSPPRQGGAAPDRLSYSDLALYDGCGLRFWAQRVLRVGTIDLAVSGDPRRFGSAVHAALQLSIDGEAPSAERRSSLALAFELDGSQAAEMRSAVAAFLSSETAQRLGTMERVNREWGFAVRLYGAAGQVDLVGAIDAYGRSGTDALVIDYKTGASGEVSELSDRYALQAQCYALAVLRDGCDGATVIFTHPQRLDESGVPLEVAFRFTQSDVPLIEKAILSRHEDMAAGEYKQLPGWEMHQCAECPIAGGICSVPIPPGP